MLRQTEIAIQKPEAIFPKVVTHSLLATTALHIRQSLKLEDLFTATVSQLRQVLNADRVLIYRIEADGSGAVLEESTAKHWMSLKGKTVYDPHFSRYWQPLYERGRIQSIADIHSGTISKCHADFLDQFQVKANLVVPILQNQAGFWEQGSQSDLEDGAESHSLGLWGLLAVQQCAAPRQWQPSDIDLVDQIALQIELAIQQAELYKALHKEAALRKSAEGELCQWSADFEQKKSDYATDFENIHNTLTQEIADLKYSERNLFKEKALLQTTLDSIGDGVISTDIKGTIQYLNPVAERLMGWKLQEVQGIPLVDVFKIVNELTHRPVENPVLKVLRSGLIESLDPNTVLIARDGSEYPIEDSAAPIRANNGEMLGVVLTFHDVTQSRSIARKLSWQANHDELTGLYNRRAFEQHLTDALIHARTQKKTHTLCYLDLDRFKFVNDTCGHDAGDQLLQQVTALLQERIRLTDTLARLGGDEFGLLLHQCDLSQAEQVADSLRALIQDFQFIWKDKICTVGVSIGLVSINPDCVNLDGLLRSADAACYAAKERGRNCIYVYKPQDHVATQQQNDKEWIFRIDKALNENQFCLYHQKIESLSQHSCVAHSEVLVRLLNAKGELIMPQQFIPIAERYQLIPAIDQWVIKSFLSSYHAFSQETNEEEHPKERLYNINLSGGSVNDGQFFQFLKEQLAEYQVPPQNICFEITENIAITNLESAANLIHSVKELGCSFALDDFGSGMSSLAYLKHLPIDYLKIDGGFVKDINSDQMDYAMVEAFNNLSHLMGIQTIAECVENEPTLTTLKTIGVDFAQGFCIARPCPLVF